MPFILNHRFVKLSISRLLLVLVSATLFVSWGWRGHYKISSGAALSFNSEMAPFQSWIPFLADHASDADYRKDEDPNEAVRHYIDIDYYPEFRTNGRIAQTWDSIVAQHGIWTVTNTGILPWATLSTFNTLRLAMQENDWNYAMLMAADLGHYVADGHMPLHITENYNGQLTGSTGIHSRYESTMINAHIDEIVYEGDSAVYIPNVSNYIFDYLYANYLYVDSILAADLYAKTLGNTSSAEYKNALWQKTKPFTIKLFKDASHALACLLYTAWVDAGKPEMSLGTEQPLAANRLNVTVTPNPFTNLLTFHIDKPQSGLLTIGLFEANGRLIETHSFPATAEPSTTINLQASHLQAGWYLARISTATGSVSIKVIKRE